MATSYTSLLGLALPVTGELSGTWGDTVNNYITNYLDAAVAGVQIISGSQTAVTLSVTNGSSLVQVGAGATGSAQYGIIRCSGNPASLLTITAPAASKSYLIINATSTSQSVKIVGTGPTTGVTLVSGESAVVVWNGTDFIKVSSSAVDGVSTFSAGTTGFTPSTATSGAVTLAGTLATTNGGTGLTSFTANRVFYSSSTSAIGQSANLTFDGTTLTANALTTTSTVTINGGTANGVAYLNGSKVLTTGSALTFDGTKLTSGAFGNTGRRFEVNGSEALLDGAGQFDLVMGDGGVAYMSLTTTDNATGLKIRNHSGNSDIAVFERTTGNVGIGTSSPDSKLVVQGGSGTYAQIKDGTVNTFIQARSADSVGVVGTLTNHSLAFWTNSASRMTLDTSGNLGLGVTPSAWGSSGSLDGKNDFTWSSYDGSIGSNYYYNGSYKYKSSGVAVSKYAPYNGTHIWYTAPSGTAGNAITFTQAMTLDASGNLGIGTSSPGQKLEVVGTGKFNSMEIGANNSDINNANANAIAFKIQGTERMRIDTSGNLGLGVTPSAWGGIAKVFETQGGSLLSYGTNQLLLASNAYFNGTNWIYKTTGQTASYYQQLDASGHRWFTAPSGTAGNAITFTQAMTLDASGNLLVGTTSASIGASGRGVIEVNGTSDSVFASKVNGTLAAISGLASSTEVIFGAVTNVPVLFRTNNTERARITSGGYFKASNSGTYAGSTASYHELYSNASGDWIGYFTQATATNPNGVVIQYTAAAPNGTGNTFLYCQDNAAVRATIRSNGGLANYSANDVNLSDRREKINFAPAKSYLDTICAIPVQTFNYVDQNLDDDPGLTLGVVAQDVQAVAPELVMESNWGTEDNPKMRLSIYQTDLQYALMKALQELKAEFDAYKATHP